MNGYVPCGQYGFGFDAFRVVEKCADSIPIYASKSASSGSGIPLSRATMNDIFHAAAERIAPLIARLTARIEIVLADETSMRLQNRKKRGFVWVFHGRDEQSGGEFVLYVFAHMLVPRPKNNDAFTHQVCSTRPV